MKLHEIKTFRPTSHTCTIEVEPAGGTYGTFKVDVKYNYTPPSSTQHERGDPTTTEYHPPEYEIDSIMTAEPVKQLGEDGETIVHVWPKVTDASAIPGWDASDEKFVKDHLEDESGHRDY